MINTDSSPLSVLLPTIDIRTGPSKEFWSLEGRFFQYEKSLRHEIYQTTNIQWGQLGILENMNYIVSSVTWSWCLGNYGERVYISSNSPHRSNRKENIWNQCESSQCLIGKSIKIRICQSQTTQNNQGNIGKNHLELQRWLLGKTC